MADYGFGSGPFGEGPFGRADTVKDALWDRSVPQVVKDDDALVGGDLEDTMAVIGQLIDDAMERAMEFPNQGDPVTALSAAEHEETLTVLSTAEISPGVQRLEIAAADRAIVEQMFAESLSLSGKSQADGWEAVIASNLYRIPRVRAYDPDASTVGLPTIDIRTSVTISGTVTVRPPDLLTRLGSNVSILVDQADPPDFTRRAIYRHRLVRDLKVSSRMFSLVGKLVGFNLDVNGLFCITESVYNSLVGTYPNNVFVIGGRWYTDITPYQHFYDIVPMDVIPMDTAGDADLYTVTLGTPVEVSTDLWCIPVTDVEDVITMTTLGFYQLVDSLGAVYWVEEVRSDSFVDEDTGVNTNGTTGPFAVTVANLPAGPGTVVVKWTDSGAVERTADDSLVRGILAGDATGTVNYNTGAISFTTSAATSASGDILLDYDQIRVCVIASAAPATGVGSIRMIAEYACRTDYVRAAAYRAVATSGEILTEPGADLTRLEDRISAKIDIHTPIHIRVVDKAINEPGPAYYAVTGYDEVTPSRLWVGGDDGVMLKSADDGDTFAADGDFPAIPDTVSGLGNDYNKVGATGNVCASTRGAIPTVPGRAFLWDVGAGPAAWLELDNSVVDRGLLDCEMDGSSGAATWGRNPCFVGYEGRIYYSDESTDVLIQTAIGVTTETLRAIDNVDPFDNVFVVGDNGTVLHVTAWGANGTGVWGTETWTDVSTVLGGGITAQLNDVSFDLYGTLDGLIVGNGDTVYFTSDAGDSWTAKPTGTGKNFVSCYWHDGAATGYTDAWIFADDGTAYWSNNINVAGFTWTEVVLTPAEAVQGVFSSTNLNSIVVAGDEQSISLPVAP